MKAFNSLIKIMKKLRDPVSGCPWDLKQTESTLREFILEEAYELIEAIEIHSPDKQKEELGDLMLQIIFISQINQEKNNFNIKDVIKGINKKLINRHPHVFSNLKVKSADDVKVNWEKIKCEEKNAKSIISDHPEKIPSLSNAKIISEHVARV